MHFTKFPTITDAIVIIDAIPLHVPDFIDIIVGDELEAIVSPLSAMPLFVMKA